MLIKMISSDDPNLQQAAAGAIANLPQSAAANMENVMDAFTDVEGAMDSEAVMNFMEKVSNSKGGEKIARDMLDSGSPVKHETVRKVKNVASDTIGNRHFSNKLALKVQSKVVDALGPTEAENFDNATSSISAACKRPHNCKANGPIKSEGVAGCEISISASNKE